MNRRGLLPVVLAFFAAPPALAATPADRVATAVEDVPGATAVRYGARDDRGGTLDGIKVIEVGTTYVGVYHSPSASSFAVHVATSANLLDWTRRVTLDGDASQPTIAALPDGGFVVAYEKALTADLLPLITLPRELDLVNGLLGRVRLRFRHYPSLDRLLSGKPARQFTAPRTIAMTAEGTPDFSAVSWSGPANSRLELGLHHFADTDGDHFPDADRQGTGVLGGFSRWRDAKAPALDQAFLAATSLHPGFVRPPVAHIGDRDGVTLDGARLVIHDAQYRAGDQSSWRLFLRDRTGGPLRPLSPRTAGGSRSFLNATITRLTGPDGRPALFVSMFVPGEGAGAGEAGSLIMHRPE